MHVPDVLVHSQHMPFAASPCDSLSPKAIIEYDKAIKVNRIIKCKPVPQKMQCLFSFYR